VSWPRPSLGGEILVSAVVRDLVAGGSDVAFLERSDVELKGIEGRHRLFAVDLASSPTVS
jgi:class 3 adenylate cyclase